MRTSYLVALVVLLAATVKPEVSTAWTISVDCQMNPVPPPTRPYQNVDCVYAWQQGGVAMNNHGKVSADLQYWPPPFGGGSPTLMDHLESAIFNFAQASSPYRTWIKCSDIAGDFRAYMTGHLYRPFV